MRQHPFLFSALLLMAACAAEPVLEPVDYVNPYIGNISHLLVPTYPTVQLPNAMLRVYPERADFTSEYLDGLPLIVTHHRERSAFKLSVTTEDEEAPVLPLRYDNERITPYSYEVSLSDGAIDVRFAPSRHAAVYRLEGRDPLRLILSTHKGPLSYRDGRVSGSQQVDGPTRVYVCFETSPAPSGVRIEQEGDGTYAVMDFDTPSVQARYGVSFIDEAQAASNLAQEISGFDVEALAAEGRKAWNDVLSRISVRGGTEDEKTVFYTAYYRTFERPVCLSEQGRYWSAYDQAVHEDGGIPFYTDDWMWDTYRAAHPLRLLTDPALEKDILSSFLRMGEQDGTGWLPTFPEITGDSRRMNSNHTVASFADALAKGLDLPAAPVLDAAIATLTEKTLSPWSGKPAGALDAFFWDKGFFPALREGEPETDPTVHPFEKRQAVAVTLGTAYDCWCVARIAEEADCPDVALRYDSLSLNYRNLFNQETRFFHPKDREGAFVPNVDYAFPGDLGAREFYDENNAWVYRWDVQHNIADLVELMGGNENFCAELDRMFATPLGRGKYVFYSKLPDHTGNVGQFSMANEPALHIPYLYNYAGAPWKTQKRIRQLLATWFRNDVMGVPGDEDGGGMSAFVVFSGAGLYPVTPGLPVYNIGSPLFEETVISLPGGGTFTIRAKGASASCKYIREARLNGEPWDCPWISHADVMKGGVLELTMDEKPDRAWGSGTPPPSFR